MAGKRRRSSRALTAAERDATIRAAYLQLYARDADFGAELLDLYVTHAAGLGELPGHPATWWTDADLDEESRARWGGVDDAVVAYVAAVHAISRRWGLHRLAPPPWWTWAPLDVGEGLVHRWCRLRRLLGPTFGPDMFAVAYVFAESPPELPAGPWEMHVEPYAAAVERVGWRRRAELQTAAEEAERVGYSFLNAWPERDRDLAWLYRHVARHETVATIAATTAPDDPEDRWREVVDKAVDRASRRVFRGHQRDRVR